MGNLISALDICAAPGSWTQVLSRNLVKNEDSAPSLISLDLQPITPIKDSITIVADITRKDTQDKIISTGFKKTSVIVCDGAPDVTGFHEIDGYIQAQLLVAALSLCLKFSNNDAIFVGKFFKGENVSFLKSQFEFAFKNVDIVKPRSSRPTSAEHFIIGRGFKGFGNIDFLSTFEKYNKDNKENEKVYKYVTCGDLSGFDE